MLLDDDPSSPNQDRDLNNNSSAPIQVDVAQNPNANATTAPLPRVIVYASRLRSFAGHVLTEDADSITIRRIDGATQTFDKSLIVTIARLNDVDTPVHAAVLLQDGSRKEGMLELDSFDEVHLRVHRTLHRYPRSQVRLVKILPRFEDELAWIRSQLNIEDPKEHLDFCTWLIEHDRLQDAKVELESLIERHESPLAMRALRKVNARLDLERNASKSSVNTVPREDDGQSMPALVSESDVNLVRVYEIDLENPPKLRIKKETIQMLIDRYGESTLIPKEAKARKALFKLPPHEILDIMFQIRARDLYEQVEVLTEPSGLMTFRKQIHDNWLINRCGSRACHGGTEELAGRFRLHRSARLNDQIRTSNLLALNRLELDGQRMLDWSQPDQSLLYQFALPREEATNPHPEVKGWRPIFTPSARTLKKAYQSWIDEMMSHQHKDWPVAYTPWSPADRDTPASSATDPPADAR